MTNEIKSFLESRKFKYITGAVGTVIVLLLIFQAGVMFGFHRANFGYRWSESYGDNFFPRPMMGGGGMMGGFNNRDYMMSHGAFGEILKIDGSMITVKGRYEAEKNVLIDKDTVFESDEIEVKATDLKVGDDIFVIGAPNEAGQVLAKVIRILPKIITNQK
ncbi:MAG: DUF5666 domain-containing protein [Candidatus Peregrinibacteria bacterium]|nr:DUF5666 domain-containing protein [Candidatus Peregrinibacteria bacterium]